VTEARFKLWSERKEQHVSLEGRKASYVAKDLQARASTALAKLSFFCPQANVQLRQGGNERSR
jgi:hypothetical protein